MENYNALWVGGLIKQTKIVDLAHLLTLDGLLEFDNLSILQRINHKLKYNILGFDD